MLRLSASDLVKTIVLIDETESVAENSNEVLERVEAESEGTISLASTSSRCEYGTLDESGAGMLRGARDNQQKSSTRSWNLLVFSVGGRRLAAKTDEVAGISKWEENIPAPDQTPNVSVVSRDDQAALPVYDLAKLLHVRVQGDDLLCLKIKHPRGAMAICIDEEMPVLHTVDLAVIQLYRGSEFPSLGSFSSGLDEIPILSMSQLGSA